MKLATQDRIHLAISRVWGMGIIVMMLVLPFPASAALGGTITSVEADQAHMRASRRITQSPAYEVHEIQAPYGTIVREYVSPQGQVFAVAWEGPFIPDMKQLFGAYFDQYSQAVARTGRARRAPVRVQEPGLVVESSGHMRSYFGKAYLPQLMPQGVSPGEIR